MTCFEARLYRGRRCTGDLSSIVGRYAAWVREMPKKQGRSSRVDVAGKSSVRTVETMLLSQSNVCMVAFQWFF